MNMIQPIINFNILITLEGEKSDLTMSQDKISNGMFTEEQHGGLEEAA